VLLFLCMYEIHIYVAVHLRSYNIGCLKMFVSIKLDVLVLDVINLQCCFFYSVMHLKMAWILKMS
jgi:hypothetical protein